MRPVNRQYAFAEAYELQSAEFEFESAIDLEIESSAGISYIQWIQSSLNKILGLQLAVDGVIGPMTRSAIRSFQTKYGLTADGIVGPMTEAALIKAGASQPPGAGTSTPVPTAPTQTAFAQLPLSGPGYMRKLNSGQPQDPGRVWGHPQVIQALIAIGAKWNQLHPGGPRIQIGDISFVNGGKMSPHSSHQKGLDIDLRPVRNDGRELPVSYKEAAYSRSLTQELVNTIRANGVVSVKNILFNDKGVSGVTSYTGHDDHLHVSFNQPTALTQPSTPTPSVPYPAPGTTPAAGSLRSAIVNTALQEWNKWDQGKRKESESAMQSTLLNYWKTGAGTRYGYDNKLAWSAAFISWVVKKAGGGSNFKYAGAHSTYTYHAIQNRLQQNTNPFKAYRITEKRVEPGDIIVQNRGTSTFTYDNLKPDTSGTHGDIVVSVNGATIEVIGGNLSDSVSKNRHYLDANGYLKSASHFAIIKIEELGLQHEWSFEFELNPELEFAIALGMQELQ